MSEFTQIRRTARESIKVTLVNSMVTYVRQGIGAWEKFMNKDFPYPEYTTNIDLLEANHLLVLRNAFLTANIEAEALGNKPMVAKLYLANLAVTQMLEHKRSA